MATEEAFSWQDLGSSGGGSGWRKQKEMLSPSSRSGRWLSAAGRWESNHFQTAVTAGSQFSVESIINQARNWAFIPLPCNKVLFAEGTHSKMFCPRFRLKLDLISSLIPYRNIYIFSSNNFEFSVDQDNLQKSLLTGVILSL